MQQATFHDYKPECLSFYQAVVEGFSQPQKCIPPKFFYDERGSELFDQICQQPEYYLPDVERSLLAQLAGEIAGLTGNGRVLIEPGAGSAQKVRLLLDELQPAAFVPMDISFDYLKTVTQGLVAEYPWLAVHAACVDFTHSLPVPDPAPDRPRLVFFPGSSFGNFDPQEARHFLHMVRQTAGRDGMLLIGVDTRKNEQRLNAAYNDAAGVTAEFNLNLLHRMRQELDAEVDPQAFAHHARYNPQAGRIEMYLVSTRPQRITVRDNTFHFAEGEKLHTENSYKYTPEQFLTLARSCGFSPLRHWQDERDLFAIYLLQVTPDSAALS